MAESTTTQSVILSKTKFPSKKDAKKWLKKNDFKTELDETSDSWRARQKKPGKFKDSSFRTIELTDGVKAVIGKKK